MSHLRTARLACESLEQPIGIEERQPRFSWIVESDAANVQQSAWQIKVMAGDQLYWDSGKVNSNETHHIRYAGESLQPLTEYTWSLMVWDAQDQQSVEETSSFVTAVFEDHEWQAKWMRYPLGNLHPSPHMRRIFEIEKEISSAYLIMSAKGIFDPYVNGQRICDDYFMPGWTDYNKRQHYRVFDVKTFLGQGQQCIGAIIGEGWWSGQVGWAKAGIYGTNMFLMAELHITYADGSSDCIYSDDQWRAAHGPYLQTSIMHGEHYDARLEIPDWSNAGGAGDWREVVLESLSEGKDALWGAKEPTTLGAPLHAHPGVPVRGMEAIQAQALHTSPEGAFIYDFGQNMAAVTRLEINLPKGTVLRLRHAEMVTPEGSLYTENLRSAQATDFYTCKGGGEIYDPRFTFHGFRYVEISGITEALDLTHVQAIPLTSDTEYIGQFTCSNEMLNQLQSNIQWTQRANFLEVPTDCPQRDERLGWTGDAQVFISTACANANVEAFFRKWLNDMIDSQTEAGAIPVVIPAVGMGLEADAAWGDAITVCPTDLYTAYGDPELLAQWYPRMKAFCDFYKKDIREDGTRGGPFCFGDWLALDVDDFTNCSGGTPKDLIQTAYYVLSCRLTAAAARRAQDEQGAIELEQRADAAAQAFEAVYFDADAKSKCGTQTSYVLALHFNLLPAEKQERALEHFIDVLHNDKDHLTCGFVGVSYLLPCLAKFGKFEMAYTLLENTSFPSWGYSIENGATTIWERWNGWIKGEGPGDANMNSYSHYAYGSVGKFIYDTVVGLKPLEPGYRKASIAPYPGGSLTHASYEYESIVGKWTLSWSKSDGQFQCEFQIPANTSALVSLPVTESVTINGMAIEAHEGIRNLRVEDGRLCFDAVSGTYACSSQATLSAKI